MCVTMPWFILFLQVKNKPHLCCNDGAFILVLGVVAYNYLSSQYSGVVWDYMSQFSSVAYDYNSQFPGAVQPVSWCCVWLLKPVHEFRRSICMTNEASILVWYDCNQPGDLVWYMMATASILVWYDCNQPGDLVWYMMATASILG